MDHVRVDSVPQGATATLTYIPGMRDERLAGKVDTLTCGKTPCAFEVFRSRNGIVRIEKDGYEPVEYFVGPSKLRGSAAINLAGTATPTGLSALAGLSIGNMTQAVFGSISSLSGINTTSGATVGTGIGLGIAATGLLVDLGTSANANFYPNPVVIGLPETGQDIDPDPLVAAYKDVLATYRKKADICQSDTRQDPSGMTCREARKDYNLAEDRLREMKRQRDSRIQRLIEELREQ